MPKANGGLIGKYRTSSIERASGIWRLDEISLARTTSVWPTLGLSGTITYTIGSAGTGGTGSANGGIGGTTIVGYSLRNIALNAYGGSGGIYQGTEGSQISGGGAIGGSTNVTGGYGRGSSGDSGGGGGGGICNGNATHSGGSGGDNGAGSVDSTDLFAVLASLGEPTSSPGSGSGSGSGGSNNRGGNATGFGCGGGGAGYWGGDGGNGRYGGGGGGASGYGQTWRGGNGGQGCVILEFYDGSTYSPVLLTSGTSYQIPVNTLTMKIWAIGGGGGGSGATNNDGDSGGGGGAGGLAYILVQ